MTDFEGCYLTAAGHALSEQKGINLSFTRVETGSGVYKSPDEVRSLSQLKHKEYDCNLEDAQMVAGDGAEVIFYVTNKGVTDEYKLTELGIYAKDEHGEEILYCVAFAYEEHAELIDPEVTGQITYCRKFRVKVRVAESASVAIDIDGTDHEWVINYINNLIDKELMQKAFYDAFTYLGTETASALSEEDILEAINTEWGGESSDDPNALSAAEVAAALSSDWNGETSSDPNALSAAQINEILTAPGGAQLTAAEITALLS